jgi:DNA polymerase III alpha subunit (gram-positive type)
MNFNERPLIVIDVETTGLDPQLDDLIEIGAIKLDQKTLEEVGSFERKVRLQHPERIAPEAIAINGYTEEGWLEAVALETAMGEFAPFAADGVFVAHNVCFDYGFVAESFRRSGVKDTMDYHRIDLPSIAWSRFPDRTKLNLSEIARDLGIGAEPTPHRALTGARWATAVLRKLRETGF